MGRALSGRGAQCGTVLGPQPHTASAPNTAVFHAGAAWDRTICGTGYHKGVSANGGRESSREKKQHQEVKLETQALCKGAAGQECRVGSVA